MNLVIFGASGRTGSRILRKALRKGYHVTAFTRLKDKICDEHPNLTIFEGDVLDYEAVQKVIVGKDAVCVALGADDISKPIRMLSEGTKNILRAMQAHRVDRLVQLAGAGILDHPSGELRGDVDYPPFLQYVFADQYRVFQELKDSDCKWTLICPTLMPEKKATGTVRIQEDLLPENAQPVPVEDVASIMFDILTQERFVGKRIGVAL